MVSAIGAGKLIPYQSGDGDHDHPVSNGYAAVYVPAPQARESRRPCLAAAVNPTPDELQAEAQLLAAAS